MDKYSAAQLLTKNRARPHNRIAPGIRHGENCSTRKASRAKVWHYHAQKDFCLEPIFLI
jgi:hypothetical protein